MAYASLEIRFAHKKTKPIFNPFFKNGQRVEKVSILQTAGDDDLRQARRQACRSDMHQS